MNLFALCYDTALQVDLILIFSLECQIRYQLLVVRKLRNQVHHHVSATVQEYLGLVFIVQRVHNMDVKFALYLTQACHWIVQHQDTHHLVEN